MATDRRYQLRVILGGTFDPIHRGHLQYALEAAAVLGGPIRLMPAADPVHRATPGASLDHRWRMIELATAGSPELLADATEIRLGTPTYTARTLRHLRAACPDTAPVMLLGSDAFAGMPRWRDYPTVLDLGHFVHVRRPGHDDCVCDQAWAEQVARRSVADPAELFATRGGLMLELELDLIEAAATAVREAVAARQTLKRWLPPEVAAYIERHGLYREQR